ncbi:MAG: hypothetical protein OEL83_19175 [Desulforhopalus sp.]|nr:hypothetical protein [Desulforhopalus sp.]
MAGDNKALANPKLPQGVDDDTILKIAKEITVKFIEVGRITPTTFATTFSNIYSTIDKTVRGNKS